MRSGWARDARVDRDPGNGRRADGGSHRGGPWAGWAGWLVENGLLAFVYLAVARVGLSLAHFHDAATLVWPPTGLALAAVLLRGPRILPGIFLGALGITGTAADPGLAASLGIAVGNSLEALIGALLLRAAGFRPDFGRPRDVFAFLLLGVLACTLVSATIGTVSLRLFTPMPAEDFLTVWLVWWLGDQGGALVLAPALLLTVHGTPAWSVLLRRLEYWAVVAFLAGTGALLFFFPFSDVLRGTSLLPCFPVLVWAGTRMGSRGAMTASFLILATTIAATILGYGPLSVASSTETALLLWSYSMIVGLMALSLAAVVEERDAADRRYRDGEADRVRSERAAALLRERERLTREMHDGLGGQLVSALSLVEGGRGSPREIAELLRRGLDEIRVVIDSLDPETTDLLTSLGKLRARLTTLLHRNGIELGWSVDAGSELREIGPEESLHLLRIVQEAVTNAVRHADPGRIDVAVALEEEGGRRLRVRVQDDGCGLPDGSLAGGRGTRIMQSRAEEMGASLRVESAGPGTRVDLLLPLEGDAGSGRLSPSGSA